MKKTIQIIVLATLCLNLTTKAQQPAKSSSLQKGYTGRVVSASSGEFLPGAIIKINPSNQTLVTNDRGEFSLILSDGSYDLSVHYVSFKAKTLAVQIPLKELLIISLDNDEQSLQEVEINAGYYTVKERERTGSISRVSSETIGKQPVSNPLMALQNRVPGLEITQQTGTPGGGVKVQIRGRNSINTAVGNDPLYVVDGVFYPSTSISSSLTSGILGIGGASPLSFINPSDIESIEVLKDADATAIYGSKGANGVILIKTKRGTTGAIKVNAGATQGWSNVDRRLKLLNTEQYLEMRKEAFQNDGLTPGVRDYDVNGAWDQNRYTDWQKTLIGGNALTTNASANVSGGNHKLNFLIGGTYYQEGTVFPGEFGYRRAGMNTSLNFGAIEDRLNVGLTLNYTNTMHDLLTGDPTSNILLAPNAPNPYDENGKLNWEDNTVYRNPMQYLMQSNEKETYNLIANVSVRYRIFTNLFLKASLGYASITGSEYRKTPMASRSTALNPTSLNRIADFSNNDNNTLMAEPQLTYKEEIGPGTFDALVGLTFQGNINEIRSIRATGFNSDEQLRNIAAAATLSTLDMISSQYRYTAVFSRLNYQINSKYFLNFTARRDGSSRFGSGKQFANFGAVGAGWIFSDEPIIKNNIPFLSFGKLRASYGITGNDQIPNYGYLQLWNSLSGTYQGVPTIQPLLGSIGNPDFSWETNRKLEAALQLGFIENRINVELSWYRNRSSNQLIGDPLPPSTGSSTITANRAATVENSGWESVLDFKVVDNTHWQWNAAINITIPKNKLVSYPGIESSSDAYNYIVGQPLSISRVYNVRGINSQTGLYDIEDSDNNGVLNDIDRYLHKFSGQYFYGGVQNSVRFKQFLLDFLVSFSKQNSTNSYLNGSFSPGFWDYIGPTTNQPIIALKRWKKVGDQTSISKASTIPASYTNYTRARSSGGESIQDASFLRLKNISIHYSLPKKWLNHIKVDGARISLQGQNVFTWTKYLGLDPETQSMSLLPPLRTLAVGLNITL
ncbi:SusC/RagA family TonB-linked outer membrane protein [Pedobacter psychroterrae]|uniref:SusC/RagA family TonB-linked outer membrane protein n=1 Tax=Pedobacter psychroterrae TaxID=2530453 RepID=A0A4R0NKF7_9SPHI|nr:SusC/RagA family TonB-linked outer membrane protein [Pedobacter psychroterrae]TCD01232.1 SusC/RagA family TonB-linked outer membrane protein [Pedobacter psychroterrae]